MKASRREFLARVGIGSLGLAAVSAYAADANIQRTSFAKKSLMKLGTVTYQLAQDWDIDTIIKNCSAAKFEGVELRTSHKHGVEVTLGKAEREQVKKRFQDSDVELMGLGSAFDYH